MNCIFCKKKTRKEPVEHIVPEGLIGEQMFKVDAPVRGLYSDRTLVLSQGEVCKECNSKVAALDQKLQKELGIMKVFLNPVGTKKGRPARVQQPGVYGERRPNGPYFVLNAENHRITTPEGRVVEPASDKVNALKTTSFDVGSDGVARANIQQKMNFSKKIFRAVHKIGFEMLALTFGADFVLRSRYDGIREYVLNGRGSRSLIFKTKASWQEMIKPEISVERIPGFSDYLVSVRIGVPFIVDMTPTQFVGIGKEKELREAGFIILRDNHLAVAGGETS